MSDNSKYEKLLDDLSFVEDQFLSFINKNKELLPKVESLESTNKVLFLENSNLKIKNMELENKIESLNKEIIKLQNAKNLIDKDDKKDVKDQIDEIINKIDEYLCS